jgi:hypothetical protein
MLKVVAGQATLLASMMPRMHSCNMSVKAMIGPVVLAIARLYARDNPDLLIQ